MAVRKKRLLLWSTLSGLLIISATAVAGVVIGGLRFIYPENSKSLSVSLRNTASESYLVQSKVLQDDGQDSPGLLSPIPRPVKVPFIVTPPLILMKGQNENQLRMIYTGGLPEDRESLFWLSVAAIPSVNASGESNVKIAFRQRVKLFWRPDSLTGKRNDLSWQRHNEDVTVSNQTPWYVTLSGMQINGQTVMGGMVPPFSRRQQPWCPQSGKCVISWQSVDDSGLKLPRQRVPL